MALFMIVPQPNVTVAQLNRVIREAFPDAVLELDGGTGWMIVAATTAQDLSTRLGITNGETGPAIVVQVSAYFGRANANVWAWIVANWGGANG